MTAIAVLVEVKCPWHAAKVIIGEVSPGAGYKIKCPHCGKYREGVA